GPSVPSRTARCRSNASQSGPTLIVACAASPSRPALARSVDGHFAQATIHAQDLGNGESRLIRGKVDGGFGDFYGLTIPFNRNLVCKFFVERGHSLGCQSLRLQGVGDNRSRADPVHADAPILEFV